MVDQASSGARASTGVSGLDAILMGGLERQQLYLVEGTPGSGKTALALHFLMEGARRGEKCLYITLSETERELRRVAEGHGWSLEGITIFELIPLEADPEQQQGLIHPSDVEFDQTVGLIISKMRELVPDRVVIDAFKTFAGGLPEVVKHAETGFLLPVGDIEGMAARTIEILKDEEHWRCLGQAGRRRAAALFGAERVVSQYERFYEKVMAGA